MKDIQSQLDSRRINIKKVGVKTVSYPITVRDKARREQHTVATVNMYVNLPHKFKGTHMSRFVEILNEFHSRIDMKSFQAILDKMKDRLNAEASHLEIEFPYFLEKAKSSGAKTLGNYRCTMHGSLEEENELVLGIEVPITLPVTERTPRRLPGSYGRWGHVQAQIRFSQFYWIEDIIHTIEQAIDNEVTDLLAQQRQVLSVEGLTRRVGQSLEQVSEISWFLVTVNNFSNDCSTFATMESCNVTH